MICQPGGELLLRQGAEVLQCGAPEHFVEAGRVGCDLLRVELRRKAPEQRLKGRLGGRAEDGRGVVMLDELGDGTDAGGKVVAREGLRLVEDDDAVGDVVELAAAAAAVGVERLEELHRRRHHNGGVPVFAGQHLAVLGGGQVVLLNSLVLGVGEVGQNIFCAQQAREDGGGLIDDGHIRNDVDDPLHLLGGGVLQRKGEGGKGLAAAGGYGEGVEPLWAVRAFLEAGAEDGVALDADGRGRFSTEIALRLCRDDVPQRGDVRAAAPGCGLAVHEGLGVDEVGVHEAGVEHPGKEREAQRVGAGPRGRRRGGERYFLPAVVGGYWLLAPAKQGGVARVIGGAPAVGQAAVVSGHGKGSVEMLANPGLLRPGGGVVHLGTAFEPQLEGVAVFADIVEPRGKFGLALRPEGGCEGTGQSGSAGEMVVDGLGASAVLADVGKTCGVLHKMTS